MIRYQTANVQVTDVRISSRNNEVESVAGCVGRLGDVLSTAERLQQLGKTYSVHVVTLVDVYIKIATDDNWTAVRRQLLKGRRQFVEEQRRERLTAGPVETEQNEATVTRRRIAVKVLKRRDVAVEAPLLKVDRAPVDERQTAVV